MLNKSRRRKNNSGFTLVELVCAIAILAIVGISIVSFVSISSKSFSESSSDVNLQYEAQVAANQIKDLVMNSNRAVHYYEVTSPSEAHCFMVLNEKPIVVSGVSTYEFPAVKIWYVPDDNVIYYATKTFSFDEVNQKYVESGNTKVDMKELGESISSGSVLAKNVSSFTVDDSKADTEGKVELSIGVSISGKTYTSNPVIVMRNKVIASANAAEIFTGARVEISDGRIDSAEILYNGNSVTGHTLDWAYNGINKPWSGSFTADVDAVHMSSDVLWSLVRDDGKTSTSSISPSGNTCTVYIAPDETNTTLTLKALLSDDTERKVTLKVPSIDMTTGYIQTLTVKPKSKDNSGVLYETYSFTVESSFFNPDACDKGFTYALKKGSSLCDGENDPKISKSVEDGKDVLTVTFNKDNAPTSAAYKIEVTSKDKNSSGECIIAESDEMNVKQLYDDITPSITLSANKNTNTLVRNDSTKLSYSTTGISGAVVKYEISSKYNGKVYIDKNDNLWIDKDATWTSDLNFTVTATVVGGTSLDGKTTYEDKNKKRGPSASISFSIGKVGIVLTEEPQYTATISSGETKNFKYSLTNINDYESLVTSSGKPVYYYKSRLGGAIVSLEGNDIFNTNSDGLSFKFKGNPKVLGFTTNGQYITFTFTVTSLSDKSNKVSPDEEKKWDIK